MTLFVAEGLIRALNRATLKAAPRRTSTVMLHAHWRWLTTQGMRPLGDIDPAAPDLAGSPTSPASTSAAPPATTCLGSLAVRRARHPRQPPQQLQGLRRRHAHRTRRSRPARRPLRLRLRGRRPHPRPPHRPARRRLPRPDHPRDRRRRRPRHRRRARHDRARPPPAATRKPSTPSNAPRPSPRWGRAHPTRSRASAQGWIAEEALAISVFCAQVAPDLESALRLAVTHSGDSDSTGCITGHILGALHGVEAIPQRWLDQLDLKDVVDTVATDLYRCHPRPGCPQRRWHLRLEALPGCVIGN